MLKIIKGQRPALERQLVESIFRGDTQTLKSIHEKLTTRAWLTLIELDVSPQAPVDPEIPHQSDEVLT